MITHSSKVLCTHEQDHLVCYHFDEIFITGCTGSCLPVQSVMEIFFKMAAFSFHEMYEYISVWLTEGGSGLHSYVLDCS